MTQRFFVSVFLLPFTLVAAALPVLATETAGSPRPSGMTVEEQGARYGQALAAVRTFPGARLTAKAAALEDGLAPGDLAVFRQARDRIVAAWAHAFACKDVDPAQSREINGCRRAKILSCTSTWTEIGPEGSALAGLLDFRPDDGNATGGPP